MELVAKLDPLPPVSTLQSSAKQVVAAPVNPVAGPTASGNTSSEGTDKLSFLVGDEGMYLVSMGIVLISASNAATSHFVRPIISYTNATGSSSVVGVGIVASAIGQDIGMRIADADGAAVANSHGMDCKGATPGDMCAVTFPVIVAAGSTITLQFGHTVTGACTNGGTYRVGLSIYKL